MGGGDKAPTGYQPSNQAGADQSYQAFINDLGAIQGQQGQVNTGLQQQATSVQANPYYSTAQAGANTVAAQAPGVGQSLLNLGGMAQPLATQIAQTAFDPQAALYNRQYQQNQEQTNAINARNGVAGGPFGAGLAALSGQNFNTDWQNQQLQRQATGTGAIGQLGSFATNVDNAGLTTEAQGAALPSNTFLTQAQANIAALQALSQGYQTQASEAATGAGAAGNYLGLGQSATEVAQKGVAQNNAQANSAWSGLLQAGGLAADIFL